MTATNKPNKPNKPSKPKRTRITNRQVRDYVAARKPFKNSKGTLYAVQIGDLYVVYSYGAHWPLVIYDAQHKVWLRNETKYSRTTSCHASYATPLGAHTIPITVDVARTYVGRPSYAFTNLIATRLVPQLATSTCTA